MTSKPQISSENPDQPDRVEGNPKQPEGTLSIEDKPSATTTDIPEFGWSAYAERINGRFAMIGFTAILLIEAISHNTFLNWAGLIK